MQAVWLRAGISFFTALAWAACAEAQSPPSSEPREVPADVNRLLQQMSSYLGSANEFTFQADITFDHVLPSGQRLQYMAGEEVALQRPGHLYVEWTGDLGDRRFWYDGKSMTLYDPATPFYATEQAPPDIDGMLNKVEAALGFSPPLSDLMYSHPYETVRGDIQYGVDLGETSVNGRSCRSLAFVGKDIDWQIWIDTGPQLTPCKLVITYKTQPAQPQFAATFTNWNFAPRIAESIFSPQVPAGAEKVPFAPVLSRSTSK
ncbi:MAG TPA: DUF2092 domain-containing protein [Rhodopila sp.]|nr:DUF2092 domain-containing protein [Rhodopila sp.]